MTRLKRVFGEKPLFWTGSSKDDLLAFPEEVVEDFRADTFRAVYTVKFGRAVYVLHAFQKKSPSGVKTARKDVELIGRRLNEARADYEVRFAKDKK